MTLRSPRFRVGGAVLIAGLLGVLVITAERRQNAPTTVRASENDAYCEKAIPDPVPYPIPADGVDMYAKLTPIVAPPEAASADVSSSTTSLATASLRLEPAGDHVKSVITSDQAKAVETSDAYTGLEAEAELALVDNLTLRWSDGVDGADGPRLMWVVSYTLRGPTAIPTHAPQYAPGMTTTQSQCFASHMAVFVSPDKGEGLLNFFTL